MSKVFCILIWMEFGNSELGVGVDNRKFKLFLGGIEVNKEIVDFVEYFLDSRISAVYLVNSLVARLASSFIKQKFKETRNRRGV
jgi:hypothetical protein